MYNFKYYITEFDSGLGHLVPQMNVPYIQRFRRILYINKTGVLELGTVVSMYMFTYIYINCHFNIGIGLHTTKYSEKTHLHIRNKARPIDNYESALDIRNEGLDYYDN